MLVMTVTVIHYNCLVPVVRILKVFDPTKRNASPERLRSRLYGKMTIHPALILTLGDRVAQIAAQDAHASVLTFRYPGLET
jgi:hypothetical protein